MNRFGQRRKSETQSDGRRPGQTGELANERERKNNLPRTMSGNDGCTATGGVHQRKRRQWTPPGGKEKGGKSWFKLKGGNWETMKAKKTSPRAGGKKKKYPKEKD